MYFHQKYQFFKTSIFFFFSLYIGCQSLSKFWIKFPQKSIAVALKQIISRREKATVQNKLMTFYHIFWRLNLFFLEKYVIFMVITLFPGSQIRSNEARWLEFCDQQCGWVFSFLSCFDTHILSMFLVLSFNLSVYDTVA